MALAKAPSFGLFDARAPYQLKQEKPDTKSYWDRSNDEQVPHRKMEEVQKQARERLSHLKQQQTATTAAYQQQRQNASPPRRGSQVLLHGLAPAPARKDSNAGLLRGPWTSYRNELLEYLGEMETVQNNIAFVAASLRHYGGRREKSTMEKRQGIQMLSNLQARQAALEKATQEVVARKSEENFSLLDLELEELQAEIAALQSTLAAPTELVQKSAEPPLSPSSVVTGDHHGHHYSGTDHHLHAAAAREAEKLRVRELRDQLTHLQQLEAKLSEWSVGGVHAGGGDDRDETEGLQASLPGSYAGSVSSRGSAHSKTWTSFVDLGEHPQMYRTKESQTFKSEAMQHPGYTSGSLSHAAKTRPLNATSDSLGQSGLLGLNATISSANFNSTLNSTGRLGSAVSFASDVKDHERRERDPLHGLRAGSVTSVLSDYAEFGRQYRLPILEGSTAGDGDGNGDGDKTSIHEQPQPLPRKQVHFQLLNESGAFLPVALQAGHTKIVRPMPPSAVQADAGGDGGISKQQLRPLVTQSARGQPHPAPHYHYNGSEIPGRMIHSARPAATHGGGGRVRQSVAVLPSMMSAADSELFMSQTLKFFPTSSEQVAAAATRPATYDHGHHASLHSHSRSGGEGGGGGGDGGFGIQDGQMDPLPAGKQRAAWKSRMVVQKPGTPTAPFRSAVSKGRMIDLVGTAPDLTAGSVAGGGGGHTMTLPDGSVVGITTPRQRLGLGIPLYPALAPPGVMISAPAKLAAVKEKQRMQRQVSSSSVL